MQMAHFDKVGTLLRHSMLSSTASNYQLSIFNAVRCMSTKLFIGGLSYGTDDQSLRDAFSSFGDVLEARVITDRDTGKSRGFGFVNYSSDDSANSALSAMDGQQLNGRNIRVSHAQERTPRSNYNNSGGYGGGFGSRGAADDGY